MTNPNRKLRFRVYLDHVDQDGRIEDAAQDYESDSWIAKDKWRLPKRQKRTVS